MAMIKLENVNKSFGDLHVLKDVNLEVEEGEKLVIIGPSGSGKSTTVRCMNFLEAPSSGHVYIDGTELTSKNKTKVVRESTSMVFQQFNLYPHMTVLKNLTLAPMKLHHKSKKEAEELAYHYLDIVGLKDKADVYPTTLSGGQQQRIAIARALCSQSKIILFDEPTSALDPETIQEVLEDIYGKMHKSPYRNYLNKERPKDHPVVYMMCVDETRKIEQLVEDIKRSDIYEELKILSYPSDDYKGYSYIKIYSKNASVQNMTDYLRNMTGAEETLTFGDNDRNKTDYCYTECDQIVRKLNHQFYFKRREKAYEQCKPAKTYR